jgi:MAF protein
MTRTRLLLASTSPRRRELLALTDLPFDTAAPRVDETPFADEPPSATAARLSRDKATLLHPGRQGLVVACDTVVAISGEQLGKPRDTAEAEEMLRRLRGRSHTVFSGITVVETASGRAQTDLAETQVTMRAYTDAEIAAYVAGGDPLDKAGAYAIQHAGFRPVAGLRGCYANVVGLPLCHLTRCLLAWGIKPPADVPRVCRSHTGHDCTAFEAVLAGRPGIPAPVS